MARWLQRRRGLFETTLSASPPCARSSSFPRTAAPANQQTVSTDWSIPRNTSCTESLFPPAIPPMRTTFWFKLATRLVRPLRCLGKFTLVATKDGDEQLFKSKWSSPWKISCSYPFRHSGVEQLGACKKRTCFAFFAESPTIVGTTSNKQGLWEQNPVISAWLRHWRLNHQETKKTRNTKPGRTITWTRCQI